VKAGWGVESVKAGRRKRDTATSDRANLAIEVKRKALTARVTRVVATDHLMQFS
jgi:hypothetical protein